MEWQIMNCGGLNSFILGTWEDGQYQVSDDCLETLSGILDQLKEDEQSTRRQLAAYHVIQKDLVPLLTMVEDDPEVFSMAVKLLVSLTQPLEYTKVVNSNDKLKTIGPQPQYWEIGKMLVDAKTNCTGPKFAWCLMREVKKIIMDNGQYDMEDHDCETINQCLLLVRNLLYIQDCAGGDGLSQTHLSFLKNLFQMGIDDIILFVLNAKQKDVWGAAVVQVMSLLYRDLVGEIFLHFDDAARCWEIPCDSSTCEACEAALDRADILRPYLKTSTYSNSRNSNKSLTSGSKCEDTNKQEIKQDGEMPMQESESSGAGSGTTSMTESRSGSGSGSLDSEGQGSGYQSQREGSEGSGSVLMEKFDKLCSVTGSGENRKVKVFKQGSIEDGGSSVSSNDGETLHSEETESSVVQELGTYLIDFTTRFIKKGFSNLVYILKSSLIKNKAGVTTGKLDDSYFLWSIAFFLKFARRKELNIDFQSIKDVFNAEVVGFLVYKAFSNGEEVFIMKKNKCGNSLAMKRLHLCVSALRELFKTLSYQLATNMTEDDKQYLHNFQKDLANMSDLRQLFLWLIKQYNPDEHSVQFLQDTIITNHYFLLLLEIWIEQRMCSDKRVNMINHVRQFGTGHVMKNYGHLLRNFTSNDHHVNNCVFTMMHHVAGDCEQPEALLHVNILNTFLEIWDSDYPVTQVMNDLMEYVIQKFISKAEECPLECALQMFVGGDDDDTMADADSEKMDEGNWTAEEEDKLVMWYSDLEGNPDFVEKIIQQFDDMGVRKSKLEIVNKLYESNWLGTEEVEQVIEFDKDLQNLQDAEGNDENNSEDTIQLLSELFKIKESGESCMDISTLEEDKVLSYFLNELSKQGFKPQLNYLQRSLLEAAYVKHDGGNVDKEHIEEPIMKHCADMGKPIPLMMFCDCEEVISNNMYMRLLMEHMGFYISNESLYPRIPHEWTSFDLIEKARCLGDINPEDAKFKMDQESSHLPTPIHNALNRRHYTNEIKA